MARIDFDDALFTYIPFVKLPARQKAGVLALAREVALHGQGGFLPWTFEELRGAASLGRKEFPHLVAWMQRLCLGETQGEGEAATGIQLHGLLVATVTETGAPVLETTADLRGVVAELMRDREQEIIRNYERNRKQNRKPLSGKTEPDFPENEVETDPLFRETPSHVCAFESIDSNRIEEEIYISIDSLRSIEGETAPTVAAPETPPALTMVPADIIQAMVRYDILERTARSLLEKHGEERCAIVLAAIPHWKPPNAAARIQTALANPDKWKLPPGVTQGSLNLLTPQPGGAAPKTEQARPVGTLQALRESLTDADRKRLRCDALDRLSPVARGEYDKATSLDKPIGSLLLREIQDAEDMVLRGRLRQRTATG